MRTGINPQTLKSFEFESGYIVKNYSLLPGYLINLVIHFNQDDKVDSMTVTPVEKYLFDKEYIKTITDYLGLKQLNTDVIIQDKLSLPNLLVRYEREYSEIIIKNTSI